MKEDFSAIIENYEFNDEQNKVFLIGTNDEKYVTNND